MKNMFKLSILIIFVYFCHCVPISQQFKTYEYVYEDDRPWQITETKGQRFSLKIEGNPTTGFEWYINNHNSLNQNIIKPLNLDRLGGTRTIEEDEQPVGFVGAPSTFNFKFQAVNQGTANFDLVYKQSWENVIERRIPVTINVSAPAEGTPQVPVNHEERPIIFPSREQRPILTEPKGSK
jgi:predicted secreted protein